MRVRPWCFVLASLALALVANDRSLGQGPDSSTASGPTESNAAVQAPAGIFLPGQALFEPGATAPHPYAGDLFTRPRLTGDWWGARSALADQGLNFDLFATQFYQGVARGGEEQQFRFGGKLDYLFNLDGGKLGLWQGLFVDLHAETRYGRSINEIDGLIAPSNTPLSFPEPDANVTSLTGLKITQALSEKFAVYVGKINTLDEYPLRYSPGLITNKPGLAGFMNTSLVFNPIAARTIPYSTAGVGFAILEEGEPLFTLTVFDPEERATRGLDDLYARGAVLVPDLVLRGKPFGSPALLNIGGTWSSARYRSLDPAAYLDIISQVLKNVPALALVAPTESGSWCVYTNFYQSLWVDACDEERHWGLFGQFGVSDGNPNPIRYVANGGLGGRCMLPGRTLDTFGVGIFYLGLSDYFKSLTQPFNPQRDEYGVELFYNFAVTPWARLTADVQIARPSTVGLNTAIQPGLRFQVLF
ncbi:MAG TPA: carbohydrate porin [Gemmatales bacterium]|nr:carbohydrate porin [Gemmatales bacterium]HMP60245.1 carbohydrate porin [Gemmatales bacterium]